MNNDFYGNAVEEYMRDYSESTTKTLKKANVDDEEIEYMIQKERQYIEKLLGTNNKYTQLIMDLRLYRANETNNMISLTKYARRKNETNPGYVIQSWLRDKNTIEFLRLWEKENNAYRFDDNAAQKLIERLHEPSFTLTAKVWINETNAIGIQSRQGSKGGTIAAESIAIDFIVWLYPEKRYEFNKLVYSRLLIIDNPYIWEDKNES